MNKALIIGGTTGIGQGLSEVLATNGYKVVITGVEQHIIKDLQNSNTKNLSSKYLDCTKDNISTELEELVKQLGTIDLIVFSAGIGNLNKDLGFKVENNANKLNVLAFTEVADWSYRFFEKQGYGHLVSITSLSGLFGSRVAPAYHAAKAYQINYLEGLRQKANKTKAAIFITDVRPGFVDTPMTQGKKMFWVASKDKAAKQIFRLIRKRKSYGYVSKRWQSIAFAIRILPNWLRSRL